MILYFRFRCAGISGSYTFVVIRLSLDRKVLNVRHKNRDIREIYVLGDDFKFYQNLKYLPLTSYPSNIQSALIIYCLSGRAKLTVHEDVHWVQPEELIILLPGQFVSFN